MTTKHIFFGDSTKPQDATKPSSGTIHFEAPPMSARTPDEIKAMLELAKLEQLASQGRFAWTKKHQYLGSDPQWHELWEMLIPSGYGCPCMQDYTNYKQANPPDFTTDYAYFVWGVNLHRWVCAKLEKPELTLEQALDRWERKFDDKGNSIRP